MEIWKDVVGYEGVYSVSNHGRIRRDKPAERTTPGYIIKNSTNTHGYVQACLSKDDISRTHTVHKLVAEAFIHPRIGNMTINHKDGNKRNNSVNNLEYLSVKDNIHHNMPSGNYLVGEKHYRAKMKESQVLEIRRKYQGTRKSLVELSNEYGVSTHSISAIVYRINWRHI